MPGMDPMFSDKPPFEVLILGVAAAGFILGYVWLIRRLFPHDDGHNWRHRR
jgi:hypothetical protein